MKKRLRRWRRWRPILRPDAKRKLPEELRPEHVGRLAVGLAGLRDPGFAHLLRRIDQSPISDGNRVSVFFRGADAFAAARRAMESAHEEILVESYIVKDDATGREFLDLAAAAAGRGVTVKVLADAFGSFTTRAGFWREMRRRGVEVRLFNPIFPHLFLQPFRDHRKILVVDRRTGFTGGMNIADEYASGTDPKEGPWRDTHAMVEGAAAWELAVVFSEAWRRAGGDLELLPLEPPPPGAASVLVLDSRPGRGHDETRSVLAALVAAARERIWITNAYFAPRKRAIDRLAEAARRGVDVRILLPGKSDVPLVRHAGHGHYVSLLEKGIRVFEYGGPILHAKSIVADDFVSVVGSTNLDFRSFHFNAECNLVIFDEATALAFAAAFREDLAISTEITAPTWKRRATLHKLSDVLANTLGPLL